MTPKLSTQILRRVRNHTVNASGVGIEAAPTARERSLLVIKSGELRLFAAVLEFAHNWCRRENLQAFVRNTPDGGFEIFAVETAMKSK